MPCFLSLRCQEWCIASAPVASDFVGSIPGRTHSSCGREGDSLSDSVGFLRSLRFPTYIYTIKSPESVSVMLLREPSSGHVSYFELGSAYCCCVECCHLRVDLYTN
jgi:hypothetical protein